MALVRVYCGLASADPAARPASVGSSLTAAVVDDAGRLLDVREVSDDPTGYARLGELLAQRSSGLSGAAIAADSDDHVVTSLLTAAGRPLAVADDDAVDDYAERFADDESAEELRATPAQRRAIGLARALQAGALSATTLPAPRDLAAFKPVLAAHAALANGRQAAAVALREVLRELYPAALRAYPDPAEPLSLAVLDALPEPGMLAGAGARGREGGVAASDVVARLAEAGIADADTVNEAVTALRIAIGETPRRGGATKALTAATAEVVRHAVAAVRACDAASEALITTLSARTTPPPAGRRAARRSAESDPMAAPPAAALPSLPPPAAEPAPPRPSGGRRARPEPANEPATPRPMTAPPVAPDPVAPPPTAPRPVAPAASAGRPTSAPPADRPAPPPPPGMTPIAPGQRGPVPPAEAGEPFRPTLTTAAINSARAERQRAMSAGAGATEEPTSGFSATDLTVPVPLPRPGSADDAPPGSRARWPLVGPADERADDRATGPSSGSRAEPDPISAPPASDRVPPPWLADDMPPEPPVLRLVEPPSVAHPPRDDLDARDAGRLDAPPLRLVEHEALDSGRSERPGRTEPMERPVSSPVVNEGDGDLLIFKAAQSAWFVAHPEGEAEADWSTSADTGWRAAEQAARPSIGDETPAGLPRRVPKANLVPGSPLRDERPLRIVRDPASIAAHTTGYFRGWRRGQEIGGYAVGGRPGRQSAGGWDFSRDHGDRDDNRAYEYGGRSAGYRS